MRHRETGNLAHGRQGKGSVVGDQTHNQPETRHLYRREAGTVGGVCAGVADYFGAEAWLVRMVAAVLCVLTLGLAGIVYVGMWVALPQRRVTGLDAVDIDPAAIQSDVYGQVVSRPCEDGSCGPDKGAYIVLAVGVVALCVVMGILLARSSRMFEAWQFWPLAIIAAGVVRMVLPDVDGGRLWPFSAGLALVALGLVTLFDSLGLVAVNWGGWLLECFPLLLFGMVFYVVGACTPFWWAKLAAVVLVALFFVLGLAIFVGPGHVDQVFMMLPTQNELMFLL